MATPQGTLDPETVTQDAAMPTADQQTTETVTPDGTAQATPASKDVSGLPDEASERTKREFEKLRDDLRTEKTKREYYEGVFSSINQPAQTAPQVFDPETGLINERYVSELDLRLQQAERAAQGYQQFMYQKEEEDAYSTHPELKDDVFKAQAEGIMYHSQVNPGKYGAQFSLKDAATYLKTITKPMNDSIKADAQKEAIEQIAPKEQAALEATGGRNVQPASDDDGYEELRYRSRRGDQDALAARLHKIPPVRE